jgi:2-polyprenyl-6-hydroxyphenyl methylase/3-demethylubiquinone-9 3-methyltransferase
MNQDITVGHGISLRRVTALQAQLTTMVDRILPHKYRIYGRQYFRDKLVPRYLAARQTIYDVGGGATPYLTAARKSRLAARVVGLDISESELARAPAGCYDATQSVDIAAYAGCGDADLVICQSVLEHVHDVGGAFRSLASILRPGGRLLVFVPNRNAFFARINLLLPQGLKRRILFALYPEKQETCGFPVYYDRCTPRDFRALAGASGLTVEDERHFFICSYFFGLLPVYIIWRLWILIGARVFGGQAASTFCMVLRKPVA